MFEGIKYSIIGKALEKELIDINIVNIRDFSKDKHKKVDDTPYGGGAGMVMQIEPIFKAIKKLTSERQYDEIIYTSPDAAIEHRYSRL